jgi:hypothetical protein
MSSFKEKDIRKTKKFNKTRIKAKYKIGNKTNNKRNKLSFKMKLC